MGKKWPVPMNLPLVAVEAYVPGGGGSRIRPNKIQKMPSRPISVPKSTFPDIGELDGSWERCEQ